jgi:hypothetical protein
MAEDFFDIALYGIIFGSIVFFKGFMWLKQKRLIENTPTSKIRALAMGPVEVYGEVSHAFKKILKSPFTGSDCIYYKYLVQEERRSKNSTYWATVKKGEDSTHFYLKDNTGSVLVDPKKATIDIPEDYSFTSGLGKAPTAKIKDFMQSKNLSIKGFFGFNKKIRFVEHYIAPKDKMYVLGTAGDNPFVEDTTAQKNEEDIMIQKGNNYYYISDRPEKEILKTLKMKVIGGVYGGGALILVCLIVILKYMNLL